MHRKDLDSNIPALWSISTPDALSLQGFQKTKNGFYDEFSGKVVVDIGAWISDFLWVLSESSYPKKLIAIDPIYQNELEYQNAIKRTQKRIYDLQIMVGKWWNGNRDDDVYRMMQSLDERKKLIDSAASRRMYKWIEYFWESSEEQLRSADYIFITFLLEHIPDWIWFIENIEHHLKQGWKIIITDFFIRPPIQILLENGGIWRSSVKILGKDARKRISLEISY